MVLPNHFSLTNSGQWGLLFQLEQNIILKSCTREKLCVVPIGPLMFFLLLVSFWW